MFDAKSWMMAHIQEAQGLRDETMTVIAGLTLLWSLFEARCCDKDAKAQRIEVWTQSINLGVTLPPVFVEAFDFWKNRYVTEGATNIRFDELFSRPDRKAQVASTLLNSNSTAQERLLAVMLIIYRLRNNFFHGEKDLQTLNDQFVNFDLAAKALATALELRNK